MAEFCLDCWNGINETADSKKKYVLSRNFDFCEGCGEWKHVIIAERCVYYKYRFKCIVLPSIFFGGVICFLLKILIK